jgi:hydroxymethylglutaryl-CoA synthase
MGLTAILDIARPGQLVLMCSYGSGAGSDGFIYRITDRITEAQDLAPKTTDYLDKNQMYLEYGTYAKFRKKIRMGE